MKALIIARSAAALHVMLHSLTLSQSFSPPVTLLTPWKALAWNSRNNYHSFHRRNNAALLWSRRLLVTSMLASDSTSSISRKYRHQKEHKLLPTLLLRGGGGDGNNSGSDDNRGRSLFRHLSIGRRGRRGLSSSSAIAATTNQLDASDGTDIIDKEAQASLSIVGLSVKTSTMEDIPYLNTKKCDEFRVLFVLGGPGAGKGTQSDLMKEYYPCVHLSAGELLRAETTKEGSQHKELIESCLVSGNIVPVEISLTLLENAMKEAAAIHGNSLIFLVDGFPRNFDNLEGWIRCMASKRVATVWGVLNYQCPLEELERRILIRAKDSGRSDDNLQSARKRFATFERETVPVVNVLRRVEEKLHEKSQPALHIFDISGDQTVENVWKDTQEAMNQMISYDVLTAQSQLFESIETKDSDLYRQLCADEWFEDELPEVAFRRLEGEYSLGPISNMKVTFQSGTKVAVEYDRTLEGNLQVHEKRIWSCEGISGWKNIHFARFPAQ